MNRFAASGLRVRRVSGSGSSRCTAWWSYVVIGSINTQWGRGMPVSPVLASFGHVVKQRASDACSSGIRLLRVSVRPQVREVPKPEGLKPSVKLA